MKVLVLDFDGVLNSRRFMIEWRERGEKGAPGLDPKAVVHLNRICEESGAYVVVSSSWRYGHSLAELKDILRAAGFTGIVRDRTPMSHEISSDSIIALADARGREIDAWLRTWPGDPVESFVILDDDSDTDPHKDRHVQTDFEDGLLAHHVDAALAILQRPWPGYKK